MLNPQRSAVPAADTCSRLSSPAVSEVGQQDSLPLPDKVNANLEWLPSKAPFKLNGVSSSRVNLSDVKISCPDLSLQHPLSTLGLFFFF